MIRIDIPEQPVRLTNEEDDLSAYYDSLKKKWKKGAFGFFIKNWPHTNLTYCSLFISIAFSAWLFFGVYGIDVWIDDGGFWDYIVGCVIFVVFVNISFVIVSGLLFFPFVFWAFRNKKYEIEGKLWAIGLWRDSLQRIAIKYPGIERCDYDVVWFSKVKFIEFCDFLLRRMEDSEHVALRGAAMNAWKTCSDREFEIKTAEWYRMQGYEVSLTKQSCDGGIDVIATKNGETKYIQCKQYAEPVPVSVVRELYGVMSLDQVSCGGIVCLKGATSGAREFAHKTGIEIITVEEISRSLCVLIEPIGGRNKHRISPCDFNDCNYMYSGFGEFGIVGESFDNISDVRDYIFRNKNAFRQDYILVLIKDKYKYIVYGDKCKMNIPKGIILGSVDPESGRVYYTRPLSREQKKWLNRNSY